MLDLDAIQFYTADISFELDAKAKITRWLINTANAYNKEIAHIEYVFCSDRYLLDINRKYLDHNYYTDIITFPLESDPIEATIYLSLERVKDNAKSMQKTFEEELYRVMVHGLLHLLGFDDGTALEKKKMRELEDVALAALS